MVLENCEINKNIVRILQKLQLINKKYMKFCLQARNFIFIIFSLCFTSTPLETKCFLTLSGGIEMEHWPKLD